MELLTFFIRSNNDWTGWVSVQMAREIQCLKFVAESKDRWWKFYYCNLKVLNDSAIFRFCSMTFTFLPRKFLVTKCFIHEWLTLFCSLTKGRWSSTTGTWKYMCLSRLLDVGIISIVRRRNKGYDLLKRLNRLDPGKNFA